MYRYLNLFLILILPLFANFRNTKQRFLRRPAPSRSADPLCSISIKLCFIEMDGWRRMLKEAAAPKWEQALP
jgi:hypothetical protein